MTKYARFDADNRVIEIFEHSDITPDQVHVPELAMQFVKVPDNVTPNSVKKSNGKWDIAPVPGTEAAKNMLNAASFRSKLRLAEKLKWDNPDTLEAESRAIIITLKNEFAHGDLDADAESTKELFDALESAGVIGAGRSAELLK